MVTDMIQSQLVDDVTSNAEATVALGQAIRDRRNELGMTIEVCAVTAGIAVKTLSRVEAGENATFRVLDKIAEALDMPLPELVAKRAS